MNNQNDFQYTYTPAPKTEREAAEKIRRQYLRPEEDRFDQLKRLDEKVKRPGMIASFILGIFGTLVLGGGMSLVMIWSRMAAGIFLGIPGIVLIALAYPVYLRITEKRKRAFAPEIFRLTDELARTN